MRPNRYIYSSLFAAILLMACGGPSTKTSEPKFEISYPFTIDLSKTYPKETISLQELFGDMEYVALEIKEECLISMNNGVVVTEDNIFYQNRGAEILRFSRDGKFLNRVCRDGRGPGELLSVTSWTVNDNIQEVFVLDILSKQISVFDYSGKFKRRFKTHGRYEDINVFNDSLLVASTGQTHPSEKAYLEYNFNPYYLISAKDGAVIDSLLTPRDRITFSVNSWSVDAPINSAQHTDGLILSEYQIDTTFLMKHDGSLEPRFIKTPYATETPDEKRQSICAVFETDSTAYFLHVNYADFTENDYEFLMENSIIRGLRLDKFTGEIYNTTLYNADIKDDSDNKMVFIVVKQPPFCKYYEAMQLIELRDAGKLSGKLAEVAAGLTEEDNPVIMIQK